MSGSYGGLGPAVPNPYAVPTSAPPGSYDPALDAAGQNAQYGYLFGTQDYELGNQQRANTMYGDPALGTAGTVGSINAGHQQAVADLIRQYANLAGSQGNAAAARGLSSGGYVAQAAAKRAANQALTRGRLDYGYQQSLASAQQAFDRANSEANTQQARAQFTYEQLFQPQLDAQKVYSAQQGGMLPVVQPFPRVTNPRAWGKPRRP